MERLSFSYIIGTRQQLNNLTIDSLTVGDSSIKSSQPVRNLGSWFDSHLSMHRSALPHSTTCITSIESGNFSHETTEKLVHAFISISIVSSIDYCIIIACCTTHHPTKSTSCRVQNATAWLVCGVLFHHITPTLLELHWLPVKFWIEFKILLLTFRALHGDPGRNPGQDPIQDPTGS